MFLIAAPTVYKNNDQKQICNCDQCPVSREACKYFILAQEYKADAIDANNRLNKIKKILKMVLDEKEI